MRHTHRRHDLERMRHTPTHILTHTHTHIHTVASACDIHANPQTPSYTRTRPPAHQTHGDKYIDAALTFAASNTTQLHNKHVDKALSYGNIPCKHACMREPTLASFVFLLPLDNDRPSVHVDAHIVACFTHCRNRQLSRSHCCPFHSLPQPAIVSHSLSPFPFTISLSPFHL